MSDSVQTRMRNNPLAPKPKTIKVTDPNAPPLAQPAPPPVQPPVPDFQANVEQPAFQASPIDQFGNQNVTLESLVALTKGGDTPTARGRRMTSAEQTAIQQGHLPSSRLTDLERNVLMKLGWQDGEPIPPDVSSEVQEAFTRYAEQKQSEGIPLEKIRMGRIEDLPEEEQARLKQSMRSAIESLQQTGQAHPAIQEFQKSDATSQYSQYPDEVKKMLSDIAQAAGVPDTPESVVPQPITQRLPVQSPPPLLPPSPPSQPQPAAPPASPQSLPSPPPPKREIPETCNTCGCDPLDDKKRIICSHCGSDPLESPETWEISVADKRKFLISLGTKRPFEKEYTIFNDTIEVRFRSLRAPEYEEISMWAVKQAASEHDLPGANIMARVGFLEACGELAVQTRVLRSLLKDSDLFWVSPEIAYPTFADWDREYGIKDMDQLMEEFSIAVPSEAVQAALRWKLGQFKLLDFRLSREANNTENFWKGI